MNTLEHLEASSSTTSCEVAPSASLTDQQLVVRQVNAFRQAQMDQDARALDVLCADELSYSHADGHVEDKTVFVANATSGRYVFDRLENLATDIRVVGAVAIVRFNWVAKQTWRDGRVTETNMSILMVWVKRNQDWKLLARSSTKL